MITHPTIPKVIASLSQVQKPKIAHGYLLGQYAYGDYILQVPYNIRAKYSEKADAYLFDFSKATFDVITQHCIERNFEILGMFFECVLPTMNHIFLQLDKSHWPVGYLILVYHNYGDKKALHVYRRDEDLSWKQEEIIFKEWSQLNA